MEVYLKINRGNRWQKLGLKKPLKYDKDYSAIFVPAEGIVTKDEVVLQTTANKGKNVVIVGNQVITPRENYKAIIDVNPALYHYGQVNCVRVIDPGTGYQPQVVIKLNRNLDLNDLDYLYRLYCAGI